MVEEQEEEKENVYIPLTEIPGAERPLGRLSRRWVDIIRTNLRDIS
jgi:hypothetical protein